jgi:hypothetical protein
LGRSKKEINPAHNRHETTSNSHFNDSAEQQLNTDELKAAAKSKVERLRTFFFGACVTYRRRRIVQQERTKNGHDKKTHKKPSVKNQREHGGSNGKKLDHQKEGDRK